MSFSIAINISDYKLFWASEALSLILNSLSLEKHFSHVHCVTLSVAMNLYAAYNFSDAAAHNLYSDNNLKAHDKTILTCCLGR